MSSVGLPRMDRAAARLMAVVVLPTPPFWFAIATIMWWWGLEAHVELPAIVGTVTGSVNESGAAGDRDLAGQR